jgi:hypothetical protein
VLDSFSFAGYIVAGLVVLGLGAAVYHRVQTMRQERERPLLAAPRRSTPPPADPHRARRVDGC